MRHAFRAILLLTLAVGAGAHLRAQSLLTNGSFEAGANPPGSPNYRILDVGSTDITGWTVRNNQLAWEHGDFSGIPNNMFTPTDGSFFLDLTGIYDNATTFGAIEQSFATNIGQTYRVQFDLITGAGSSAGPVGAHVSAGPASQTFTTSSALSTGTTFTLDFTAAATSTTLLLQGASTPAGGWFLGVDNVSVIAIPEPAASAALAGLGAVGVLLRRRFKRPAQR
jgi:hypothetical protein